MYITIHYGNRDATLKPSKPSRSRCPFSLPLFVFPRPPMISLLSSRFSNPSQSSLASPIEPTSTTISLYQQDEGVFSSTSHFLRAHPLFAPEDETITGPRALSAFQLGNQRCISQEYVPMQYSLLPPSRYPLSESDLRLLAISTHMTELSYAISDIQTRIFGVPALFNAVPE